MVERSSDRESEKMSSNEMESLDINGIGAEIRTIEKDKIMIKYYKNIII